MARPRKEKPNIAVSPVNGVPTPRGRPFTSETAREAARKRNEQAAAKKSITAAFPDFDIRVLGLEKNSRHRLREVVIDSDHSRNVRDFDYCPKLLNDISEEVHNYAINYHRSLRSRNLLKSELEKIEGIGKVKSKNLMKHFRNMSELKKASVEDIMKVEGMNRKLAEKVREFTEDEY